MSLGNIKSGTKLYKRFTTVKSDGTPIVFTGSPAVAVFSDDSTSAITTDVTLTADFGGITGRNLVVISTTDATAYPTGHEYTIEVTAGTANSVSLVGYVIDDFSIQNRFPGPDENADGVWDEVLTAATHNVATSAGRRLRQLASNIVIDGTAVSAGGNNNQIELDADASTSSGAYDPACITISGGAGMGQSRLILEYNGATKIATVDRDWKTNPDATSTYVITANPGREHVNEGLLTGASTDSVTLNAYASTSDDNYNGQLIFLRSGLGQDQVGLITDYNGTTRVATIDHIWSVTPDTTTAYVILPSHIHEPSEIATSVWASTSARAEYLDVAISTRLATTDYSTSGGASAADVWAYSTRTLTQAAASVIASVTGSNITALRGDTLSFSLTGLGSVASRSRLYFTVKQRQSDEDTEAILQIEETDGLRYYNRHAAETSTDGILTVTDASSGDITVTAAAYVMAALKANVYQYDVQMVTTTGTVSTLTAGAFTLTDTTDATRVTT